MGNVMEFLVRVGEDAAMRHASPAERDALLATLGIDDEETRAALASGDVASVRDLLGGKIYFATLMPGPDREEEAPEDDEDDNEDEEEGGPLRRKSPSPAPGKKGG
ncbi:hypothetical protein KPL74_08290 [Bacillus sp. NP157]|nr:hypothetical protein KPL74_08290 [Bacillus sp. NP157]